MTVPGLILWRAKQNSLQCKDVNHKDLQRERIRRQTQEYLARGGRIHRVPSGTSGQDPARRAPTSSVFSGERQSRTEVPEVIASIEARKQALKGRPKATRRRAKQSPRRRLVYDDFGEPLRWEWVND